MLSMVTGSGCCGRVCDLRLGSSLSPDGCLPGFAEQGPKEPAVVEGQQKTSQLAPCFSPHARRGCLVEKDTMRSNRSRALVDSGEQRLFEKCKGEGVIHLPRGKELLLTSASRFQRSLSLSLFSRPFNLITMVEVQFTFNKIHPF